MRIVTCFLFLLGLTLLTGCGHLKKNPLKKDNAKGDSREVELAEDARLPFVPLLDSMQTVDQVEIWQPTAKRSLWTPKGDAVFVGGHGLRIDRKARSLVWIQKEIMEATVESEPRILSEEELQTWDAALSSMNRVEVHGRERTCPSTEVDAQEYVQLARGDKRETILNYRKAECRASYTDTVAFERLYELMKSFGAPW